MIIELIRRESKAKQLLFLSIVFYTNNSFLCSVCRSRLFATDPSIYTIHTSLHHSLLPHGLLYVTAR